MTCIVTVTKFGADNIDTCIAVAKWAESTKKKTEDKKADCLHTAGTTLYMRTDEGAAVAAAQTRLLSRLSYSFD